MNIFMEFAQYKLIIIIIVIIIIIIIIKQLLDLFFLYQE